MAVEVYPDFLTKVVTKVTAKPALALFYYESFGFGIMNLTVSIYKLIRSSCRIWWYQAWHYSG